MYVRKRYKSHNKKKKRLKNNNRYSSCFFVVVVAVILVYFDVAVEAVKSRGDITEVLWR